MKKTISFYGSHDSSVTFLDENGDFVVLEYERFVRQRYAAFTTNLKDRPGLGTTDEQRVSFLEYIKDILSFEPELILYNELNKKDKQIISNVFPNCDFKKMEHHKAHACCAFYQSGFDEALVFSFDGGGMDFDGETTAKIYLAEGNNFKTLRKISKNIGNAYGAIGYPIKEIKNAPDSEKFSLVYAGKTMGICAYGNVKEEWKKTINDFYNQDGRNFNLLTNILNTEISLGCISGQTAYDLAATSQSVFENICLKIILPYVKKYNLNVVLTGGCALNVLFNQRLAKILKKLNLKLYVPPNPNDCGLSLGQFLCEYPQKIPEIVYNGFQILDYKKLDSYVNERSAKKVSIKNVVELLSQGKIIGVVRGNSEVGPRALGNRSIICDPSFLDMKDVLNRKVKFREWFRPFAPACILEDSYKIFEDVFESNYMSYAPKVKEEYADKLPAITHNDGTARLQTVTRDQHEFFWSVLQEMKNQERTPVILNTSFNIKGRPILTTIEDALYVLDNTEMDYVLIDDYLFEVKK